MKSPIPIIAKERVFLLKFKNLISKIMTVDIKSLNFLLNSVQKETLNSKKKELYKIISKVIEETKEVLEMLDCPLSDELKGEITRWEKLEKIISELDFKDLAGFKGELSNFIRIYEGTLYRLKHIIDEEIETDNEFLRRRRILMG